MPFLRIYRSISGILTSAVLICAAQVAFSLDEKAFRKELENDTPGLTELRDEFNSIKNTSADKEYKNSIRKELYAENRRHNELVRRVKPLLNKYKKTHDINTTNEHGQTLLMLTAAVGNDAATRMLIRENPNMTIVDKNNRTALQYEKDGSGTALLDHLRKEWATCIENGNLDTARDLLESDANPNWEVDGRTALEIAILDDNIPLVSLLMDYKASPSEKAGNGRTILELAVTQNSAECLKEILRHKESMQAKFDDGSAIFLNLLNSEKAECLCAWFFRAREHQLTQTESGTGYLHLIIRTASEEGAEMVAEDNKELLNTEDAEGNLPLFEAVRRGSSELYHALLLLGAEPGKRNSLGETIVMHACMCDNEELMEEIIRNASIEELNMRDAAGQSAYYYADQTKNETAVRLLNEAGVKKPQKN